MIDEKNYSLLAHNTFGIPAACDRFLEYESIAEAQAIAHFLRASTAPLLLLGAGSNLLLKGDFHGIVVHSAIKGIDVAPIDNDVIVRCGSGEIFDDVVDFCVTHGNHGVENLSLIPGEVGASAVQNIGAYGCEVKDVIESVEAVNLATGEVETITGSDCGYSYRNSKFKHEWKNYYLITHVSYRLSKTFQPDLDYGNIRAALAENHILTPSAKELRQSIIAIREKKLPNPKVLGNAGSFFMNPLVDAHTFERLITRYPVMPFYKVGETLYKIPAGWLIEQCGWKGKHLGRAGVYEKQALVLVNLGGAKGTDIIALSDAIIHDVKKKFGISIHPEVNIV
ncbi:UDP-N-acetylmuramate dehydrogenase [Segatella oulorum]|uniref:UDP-N-acetylmuramate dehydrogenase n=1 Tax=Segatella oulorum TaxID=28136 RepID=UPI0028E601C5|nr:UDP-N-acetylmuramate dehydrogenase [Segatella oulorum]